MRRDKGGRRRRSPVDTFEEGQLGEFPDWISENPRTSFRRFREFLKNGIRPVANFAECRIALLAAVRSCDIATVMENPLLDFFSFMHEVIGNALFLDQLVVFNCASFGMLLRKTQQIRHALSLNHLKPVLENTEFFMGSLITKEDQVDSELNEHIASKMKAKQKLLKERRLLAEGNKARGR